MRGYNLKQTKAQNTIRRANARLKSLYNKYGYAGPYLDELARLTLYREFDKYIDYSKGYAQIKPPTQGRLPYKNIDATYQHLINVADKVTTIPEHKKRVSEELGIRVDDITKDVEDAYYSIKNQLKHRMEEVYEYMTTEEVKRFTDGLGNIKGSKKKTYEELKPFLAKINAMISFIEKNNGEIPSLDEL